MPLQNKRLARKNVTLLEIAQVAGVSKATVSLVMSGRPNAFPISEATRRRVMETAKSLGYRPNAAAKALATGRSYTVLMVAFDLWDENLVERLRGVEATIVQKGYSVRVCTVSAGIGLDSCVEIIRSGQADGVLLTGLASPETVSALGVIRTEASMMGLPIVALANAFPQVDAEATIADIDDAGGAESVVAHLLGHGRRRIVLLGVANQPWAENRERGYRAALNSAGVSIDPELIVLGDRSQTWAYNKTIELVGHLDFDGMFAVTDNMALAALAALKSAGKRVPEDCAVVGFDNNEKIARFTDPPLTTVDNPFYETGRQAGDIMMSLMESKPIEVKILPVSLVIRQSCGCKQ